MIKKWLKNLLLRKNCLRFIYNIYLSILFWLNLIKTIPDNFRCYLYNYIISYIPIHSLRIWTLKNLLHVYVGKGCFVHLGAFFSGKIYIGDDTVIGRNVTIIGEVKIGSHCSISAETYIVAAGHDKDSNSFIGINREIIIDDYVWTGTRSMILMGVHVYTGGVLGAQSVLTKDIPEYTVYAGTPAKKIGSRKSDLSYELRYFPFFN